MAADPNLAREGPGLVERFLLQPPAEGREGPLTLTRTRTRTRTLSLTLTSTLNLNPYPNP